MVEQEQDSLFALLKEVQLEHFYHAIKSIDVTKVEHFENVVFEDLTNPQVGMGPPAARRLLEAAKKRNNKWKKNLFSIIMPVKTKEKEEKSFDKIILDNESNGDTTGLTCLIPNKDIKLLDKIGDGSFGVVMRAQWTQPNKKTKYVAVKVLKQEVLLRALEDFAKEVNSMHQLNHPHLIKLYGIVLSSPMMMVTELAQQGSLRSKLIKTSGRISYTTLVIYAIQIAAGMDYLETKRLIHRDLATRNIFITETDAIKIGDFGLMRSVPCGDDYYTMSENMRVPFPWCAIESLKYRQFSHSSDTWMYGVTLWEIFSFGQEPWVGLNGSQIIKKLEQNERLTMPNVCSPEFYQVMSLCWKAEPKERPTFGSIINYFKKSKPMRLKATTEFDSGSSKYSNYVDKNLNKTYLKVCIGDEIDVIEGRSENYWWKGQNQRTFDVGIFPRVIAKDVANLKHNDISKPLKNSFIHTGHMDPMGKKSWGNPEFIEKMYLEHPIEPPDVLGFDTDCLPAPELETRGGEKRRLSDEEKKYKIAKILNIDQLDVKENDIESEENGLKEDILIDLNSEVTINSIKAQELLLSMQNDLVGINFEQSSKPRPQVSLSSAPPPIPPPPAIVRLPPKPTDLLSSLESTNLTTQLPPVEQENKAELDVEPKLNLDYTNPLETTGRKYYCPPVESSVENVGSIVAQQEAQQPNKTRYYSSVCSNCDFSNDQPSSFLSSSASCMLSQGKCQCCNEFYPGSVHSQCSQTPYMPGSHCTFDTCGEFTCAARPPANTCYQPTSSVTVQNDLNCLADRNKPVYQTKICQDFIQELEANFARLGHNREGNSENDNILPAAPVSEFPVINPPPKSYKTRRPAPPPPVQKKVN